MNNAKIATTIFLIFSATFFTVDESYASFDTGNELKKFCASDEPDVLYGFCMGLISGVYEGYNTATEILDRAHCVPKGVTRIQMRDVVKNFMDENPQLLHKEAAFIIMVALIKNFPCR